MAITAIMPYNLANKTVLSFEGRKNSRQSVPDYDPHRSPVKKLAVPLVATVLAMQPVNASLKHYDMGFDNDNKIEMPVNEPRVVGVAEYDRPSSEYKRCTIYYISTDGNDDDAEELQLSFPTAGGFNRYVKRNGTTEKIPSVRHDLYSLRVDTLKEQDVTRILLDGTKEQYKRYFVSGDGAYTTYSVEKETGEQFNYSQKKQPVSIEINKDFYDTLADMMGRGVNYVKESATEKEKEIDVTDILMDFFGY